MIETGKRFTCDRCGKQEFFAFGEFFLEGDISGWLSDKSDIQLCPECNEKGKILHKRFMKGEFDGEE